MSRLKWALLTETYGRMNAELLQSLLIANGIDVELFQEAVGGNFAYPTNIGEFARVQIFVPIKQLPDAKEILENSQDGSMENSIY